MFDSVENLKEYISKILINLIDKKYEAIKENNKEIAIGYLSAINDVHLLLTGIDLKEKV